MESFWTSIVRLGFPQTHTAKVRHPQLPTVTAAACATQLPATRIADAMSLGVAVVVTVFGIVDVAFLGVVVADVVTIVYRSMLLSVVVVVAAVAHWVGVTAPPVVVAA